MEKAINKVYDFRIDQFFILQKYKGKGLGKKAALMTFDLYSGKWQFNQIENNYPAQAFWRSTIKEYTKNT
ncbi:hypothetical protein ACFSCX_11915 [Bacillus salitolerans]|uniref:GNAT family N-acetyltransferase n=1 Tax=Bacillus salitolerans TaxID=1437434 RepID=A0ABW4LR69_9BACI